MTGAPDRAGTEALLRRLSDELTPVRPLPRLRVVCAAVGAAFGLGLLASYALGYPLPFAVALPWSSPAFALLLPGLVLLAAGGALAGLASAVPGREDAQRQAARVGISGAVLAAASALAWLLGAAELEASFPWGSTFACSVRALGVGLAPGLLALAFVARGAPVRPAAACLLALAAASALGAAAVHASCGNTGPVHVAGGHLLGPVLLALALGLLPALAAARRFR